MVKNIIKLTLLGLITFLGGCENPVEDINLVLDTDEIINTTIAVELTDAANGNPISSDAEISISGIDASYVLDIVGERNYEVTPGDGLVTLILHPDAQPSLSEPVEFTLNVNTDGYESYSRNITITEIGNTVESIPLVNRAAPPSDVFVLETSISTDASGSLTSDVKLSSETSNGRIKNLGFIIEGLLKSGTKFLDADGNILIGDVKIVFRGADGTNIIGGFQRTILNNLGTVEEMFSLLPDAQLKIEITVDGVTAYATTEDFDISFKFDDNFNINQIKALFQPIEGSASILDSGSTELSSDGSSIFFSTKLFGTIDISKFGRIKKLVNKIFTPISIDVSSNIQPTIDEAKYYTDKFNFTIYYKDSVTANYKPFLYQKFSFHNSSELSFIGLPGISEYKIDVFNDFDKSVIGSATIVSDQSNSISLDFTKSSVNFLLIGTCDGGDLQVGPTATVYYKPASSSANPTILGTIQSGKMVTYKLDQGIEYEFSTRFNGNIVSASGLINQSDYSETRELPANICDSF